MIKAYVINLEKDAERLKFIGERFSSLGIPFERFPAVNGANISDAELEEFARARSGIRKIGVWTRGSMACLLSHKALWEKAAQSEEKYTAIFEDDVFMSDDMAEFMKSDHWIPADCDIVRLETPSNLRIKLSGTEFKTHSNRKIQKVIPNKFRKAWPLGAAAYIVSRGAAQKILQAYPETHLFADDALFNCSVSPLAKSLIVYQINPACCIQDNDYKSVNKNGFSSNIQLSEEIHRAHEGAVFRFVKDCALNTGILQIFRILRGWGHVLHGYRRVKFAK